MGRATLMRGLHSVAVMVGTIVLAATLATGTATAQIDPAKLPAARTAAASLLAIAKGSETTGRVPRANDPAVRQLLDTVFDARDVVAGRGISFQELGLLTERMVTGARIGTVYMLAGTGATDLAQLANDPQADDKVNRNVVRFAPEMGDFLDFELHIQGAVIEAVLTRLSTMRPDEAARPNFQSGIASIRQSSLRTVASVIETLAVDGLTDDWRRARLPALAAIAPRLARFLQAGQKADLQRLASARADATADPGLKRSLTAFGRTVAGGQ
ncbi:hypothetical protein [Rhodoplanes roseus]|uniref:hypothetical protein n=1 Tax=Rhodoplanes roseus TaxID=29409 RepID=UPI001474ADF4|nr:hypothetical protein [Rhodoplanes roseus]